MPAAEKLNLISQEEYLANELQSEVKHEFLGGVIYAMVGARIVHNIIAGNIFALLHSKQKGKPCQPYNSDTKIRVRLPTHTRFYYPDVSVVCDPNPQDDSFQDDPVVIIEVLSRSTRRTDEGEKRDAYLTIPTLAVYLLVEQEEAAVIAFRRMEEGFAREAYVGFDSVIPLPEIETELPLAEIYERVEFSPEPDQEDR